MSLKKNLDVIVYEQLREKVIRGEWKPGQAIAVDDLAAEYGVSRTPVLQALRRMEAIRMVRTTTTGHYMVPTFSEKQIEDLLEIRALLERQVLLDIEQKHIVLPFDRLREISERCMSLNNEGNTVETRKADLLFHSSLTETAGNEYLADLYAGIQAQFMVANYLLLSHTQEQQHIAADDHSQILDALETGRYDEARARMDRHIFGARDKMLTALRR